MLHGKLQGTNTGFLDKLRSMADGTQLMRVEDLLNLHSNEALRRKQHFSGDRYATHGDDTTVGTVYDRKAAEMAQNPAAWHLLDEPIRNGTIDPVLLETSSGGHTVVTEGQHRIVRAHQLGVAHLPVSYDPASQAHRYDWDEPEPLDPREAALTAHFEERTAAVSGDDTGYRMQHQGPDDGDGEAMHEVGSGKVYPADVHQHPEWYIAGDGPGNWDSWEKVRRSRDWPSRRVTMYRSMPSPYREINPGDWVTSSAAYARDHGRQSSPDDDWPVVKFEARADQLRTAGDSINEWSYHGPKINRALVHFSGGKNHRGKGPRGGKTDAALHEHEPPEMYAAYTEQTRQRRERLRAERETRENGQREASVQHHGISGESAPQSEDIFASPAGRGPVHEHYDRLMEHPGESVVTRPDGTREWVHPHLSAPDHGPYYVTRDRTDSDSDKGTYHVLDAQGRSTGRSYKGDGWNSGFEHAAHDWYRLTHHREPEEGMPGYGEGSLWNQIRAHHEAHPPQFPHQRTDPYDEEILRRPDARVAKPEGYSPSEEYHGSYEVVRHPGTGRFHVVDNAGRHAMTGNPSGFETQLRAERSRDYIEKRQQSKERAKGIADALYEGMHQIFDPGSTPESRESDRNLQRGQDLMTRYEGGRGKVKFDSDEEGGQPYYEREHYLDNGKPSGWYVKHYGGTHADIYHRATGDSAHDMTWLKSERFPDGTEQLSPAYGDEDLAADLKDWHDEEGGSRQHFETEDPRYDRHARAIQRWKRQHQGSRYEVVAHFEDKPEPRPFTAAASPEGGEYGPKPEWQRIPEDLSDEERSADFDRQQKIQHDWEAHVLHGISTGRLHPDRAKELGYYFDGHQTDERGDHKWKPLPQNLYHVTTNLPGVREHGLKSRRELGQLRGGHGLGGGPDDMISLTDDHGTAQGILRAVHEFHHVVNGRYAPQQMWEDAKAGKGAPRPFHEDLAGYYRSGWKDGDPLPESLRHVLNGTQAVRTEGWGPPTGEVRSLSPDERREQSAGFYKNFAAYREWAGGPENPVFFSTDTKAFAGKDPRDFAVVHVRPRPGAMGHQVSALGEWRTGTGDALETHRAERLEDGHLKEAAVSRVAARFEPGFSNPHTGGSEWFHGTQGYPEDFVHGFAHSESHDHDDEELRGHLSHWNTLLGAHFAADHGVAEHFARSGASTHDDDDDHDDELRSRYETYDAAPHYAVLHARLHLRNPKVYASEFDMDHEAYEHEHDQRKNYIANHFRDGYEDEDPHRPDYDPGTTPYGEEWPLAARFRHDDKVPVGRDEVRGGARSIFSGVPEHPVRTEWLNSHPDKAGIARRFKERLVAQGHDGILYGNEFEGGHATGDGNHPNLSAIIFHPEQAEITQHHPAGAPELSPQEAEHQRARMPQPGQEELPGVEDHADKFPNGFLRGAALIAHFEDPKTAAGPYYQQKLFHQQPDNTLHAPESGRHNPEDPEAHMRWRAEHDEEYEPDTCEHCGGDMNMPRQHAEEHQNWLGQQDWYTDWDAEGLPGTLHRGIGAALPEHVHRVVHDESRPVAERAHALASHLLGDSNQGGAGLGNFWSADPDVSKTYAESSARRYNRDGVQTPLMFHVRTPGMEHIETDPEQLQHWGVYSYHLAGNREVPIRHQAPLHVTGISWAPPGHEVREPSPHDPAWHNPGPHRFDQDPAWTHHEFADGIRANASLAVTAAEAHPYAHLDWPQDDEGPQGEFEHPEYGNRDEETGLYHHPAKGWYCHACGDFHAEPDEVEAHDTAYTNWDEEYPLLPDHVHRGVLLYGHPDLTRITHGAGPEHTARTLLGEIGDLGDHWTASEPQARHYAVSGDHGYHAADPSNFNVVVHARRPEREDIETDPWKLADRGVFGMDQHEDREVPLRRGTPVHVTGVSWKADGEPDSAWRRHDFGEGAERTAVLQAVAAPDPGPVLNSLNPTGGLFAEYDPQSRASAPLGPNMTTLAETKGVHPDTPVRLYRGAPAAQKAIVPGDFVTDDPQSAGYYAGGGRVLSLDTAHGDVLDDRTEPGGGEYIYRPRERNGPAGHTAAASRPGERAAGVVAHFEDDDAHGDSLDAFRYQAVQPYVAPPEDYEQGRDHLVAHHGYTPEMHMPRNLLGLQNVHRGLHLPGPAGPASHQHDDPADHHDPVFGSTAALEGGPDEVGSREERGDRWHEFRNRYSDDLHRGIHVELPGPLHEYVHDESEPREERAQALASHFRDQGLGMHWTPHVDIAHRAIGNAADAGHGLSGGGLYWGEPGVTTDVMFHIRKPGQRHRLPAREHDEYDIGRAYSQDEDEFPLRPGSPLRLSGISWRKHDKEHPLEPYEHVDFPKPVRHVSSVVPATAAVAARSGDQYVPSPQPGEETWRHLQEGHGVGGDRMPGADFMNVLHGRFHKGQTADLRRIPHQHETPGAPRPSRDDAVSRLFTPVPAEELEERRRAREPKPERTDDREYSIRDVSRHYDWEGFDPLEIEHLVHHPEQAVFTREDVPVGSLRHVDEHGRLIPPPSYEDIAGQDEDERERLERLEHGYEEDAPIPPIVTVRDGEHHIIADGSHRAAVHAKHGRTYIPAFVTQRTIFPGRHTAAVDYGARCGEDNPHEPHGGCPGTTFDEFYAGEPEFCGNRSAHPEHGGCFGLERDLPEHFETDPGGGGEFRTTPRPGGQPIGPVSGSRRTAMTIEPPGHFDFYHGEGSEDGKPRTSALEEHLYGHGGRYSHDYTVDDAVQRGRDEAYSGSGSNAQKRARYHDILEGLHQHEHDRALTRAHESVRYGADPSYPAQLRGELESAHRQQWQDEQDERDERDRAEREHRENGSVRMHGETVDFATMENHLRQEHGFPDDGLPSYRMPTYEHGPDPYERALEEAHNEDHGDMGSYRHDEDRYYEMHGQQLGSWDAEHHLVEHHGYEIGDLRRDEPDLEREHNANHERDEWFLSHPAWARMDEEGRLLDADADNLRDSDDAFEHRHVPYSAPPRSREELWRHLQEGHGVKQSADSTEEPGQSFMLNLHDRMHTGVEHYEGNANHQHDLPEGHDPVFGSKAARELVGHFGERGPAQLDTARDAVLPLSAPVEGVTRALAALGSWQPQDGAEAAAAARDLPLVFAALAGGLRHAASVLDGLPVDPQVAEAVHDMAGAAQRVAADAGAALPPEASWETPGSSPNH